jgi:hypothetical protein
VAFIEIASVLGYSLEWPKLVVASLGGGPGDPAHRSHAGGPSVPLSHLASSVAMWVFPK